MPRIFHLAALSIGGSVPREGFSAVVHSAFRSAVNLCVPHEDRLLTLVAAGEADFPQGIRVATPEKFSFESFKAGELASCDAEFLYLASLTVDLRGAPRWVCNLPALKADLSNPAVFHTWKSVWQVLNECQQAAHADIIAENVLHPNSDEVNPIRRQVGDAMRILLNAARLNDTAQLEIPLRALIGLGTGLTPSGDDLLVGFFTGLWCAVEEKTELCDFIVALSQEVSRLAHRTNAISRTYLLYASRGQTSSRLEHLAAAICRAEKPNNLFAAFESAVQTGHSSGMDTVTGLLLGLVVNLQDGIQTL